VCRVSESGSDGSTSQITMTDSDVHDQLAAKHERNREQRIAAVKRWVEYIKSEPVDKWGPQQNAIVDGQLDAAQHAQLSADHHQQVKTVATAIYEAAETADDSA